MKKMIEVDTEKLQGLVEFSRNLENFSQILLEQRIYFEGENRTITEACRMITNEEIDEGEFCKQTVIDLLEILNIINRELL